MFGGFGEWRQAAGTLTLNVTNGATMVAGYSYEMSIVLHNPTDAKTSNFAPLQVVAYPVQTGKETFWNPATMTGSGGPSGSVAETATLSQYHTYQMTNQELLPVYVRVIDLELNIVNQSKPFPCAINTINVGLTLNVPLLGTCKNPNTVANVYNYTPSVSISGLTGTMSEDDTVFVVGDAPFDSVLFPRWTRTTVFLFYYVL